MDKNTERKLRQLNALIRMTSLINSTLDTREVRRRAIEAAAELVDAEAGSLLLVDIERGELFFEVATGEKADEVKEVRLRMGEGIAGWVAERGEPLIVHDAQNDPRFFRGVDEKSKFKTRDLVCVPVKTKERTIGVLEAINKKNGRFDKDDMEILKAFANQVAVAIENANLYKELKETFYGTIEALAETIEKRDPYTGGHTRRVMQYSLATGRELGLSGRELENLKLAAILHDIGKIGIRDSILLKKTNLTEEEAMVMNLHPKYGAEILEHIKQLKDVIPGMRGHHEKYDGSGYPDGLKGEDIPLFARIIAVADAYDAMTTDRPYRKALSREQAFEELKKSSGRQFDPVVVNAFIKALS
ncbi:MAG: HD domain-containing protein [Thermodesulfovibrionales bacterium]|nr:HD domain-containing protein [Thermodesulfovibrionales bacterium]